MIIILDKLSFNVIRKKKKLRRVNGKTKNKMFWQPFFNLLRL